jgi:prepilin-type N-terminal cleavage/methylation domain-containing protein
MRITNANQEIRNWQFAIGNLQSAHVSAASIENSPREELQNANCKMQIAKCKLVARPGFTLLELIIVITIIAVLAALTTGVAMRFFGIQQQRNSEVTVTKANEAFKRQWDQVISDAMNESAPATTSPDYPAYSFVLSSIAGGDAARARVIWVKLRLKQEFPMSFDEVLNVSGSSPWLLPPIPEYKAAVAPLLSYPPNQYQWYTWDQQSSAMLLLALTRTRGGYSMNSDDLGTAATGELIAPPPSTAPNQLPPNLLPSVRVIVDGWKKPVVFYRWAASNTELDGLDPATGGSQVMFRDTQDPTGLLLTPAWWSSVSPNPNYRVAFESLLHPLFQIYTPPPPNYQPPTDGRPYQPTTGVPYPALTGPYPATTAPYFVIGYEYYMVPVIASSGPNKAFGLVPPPDLALAPWTPAQLSQLAAWNGMKPDGLGDDADNIYSYRLRLGAAGN